MLLIGSNTNQRRFIMSGPNNSVPLPGGGDTHIHPFGLREEDFTITTQLPRGVVIHNNPLDPLNEKTNNIKQR